MSTPETLTRELAALDDALAGRPVDPDLADLAELAILVRDERPAPDPAFAHSLDERARRGFPRTAKRRRAFTWPKFTLPALGLAASVLLVVVIATSIPSDGGGGDESGGSSSSAKSDGTINTIEKSGRTAESPPSSSDSAGGAASSSPALAAPSPHRYVERSAQITLGTTPRDIDGAAAKVIAVADDLGGYVASSQITSGEGGTFELRVPERRLQRALERLSAIGKVRNRTQAAQDITGSVVSVRSRLKDARTERASLLKQLAKATTTNQTTSIRARLRIVSRQIAAAKADLRSVKRRASTSLVSVTLEADKDAGGAAGGDDKWSPGDALRDAGRVLEVTASVLLVAGAVALPLGLIALLVWLAARQASHRRRERALDAV
jgi:Domain of unknown function (DUF4349)